MFGPKSQNDFKINFDLIQKSEAKIFGWIFEDFTHLDSIFFSSDLCNFPQLEKRETMITITGKVAQEWD
jgi:hypothetical protein